MSAISLNKSDVVAPLLSYAYDQMVRKKNKSAQSVGINIAKQMLGNAAVSFVPSNSLPSQLSANLDQDTLATGLVYMADASLRGKKGLQASAMDGGTAIVFDVVAKYVCKMYLGGDNRLW